MNKKIVRFAYFDKTVIGKQFSYTYHEYDKNNQVTCANISSSKSLDDDKNIELYNLIVELTNLIAKKID